MKAYENTSGLVTGVFPNTLAMNSSTGTATNGTPWVQDYGNDLWSWKQALLARVGMTPSGTVEGYTAIGSGSAAGLGNTVGDGAQQTLYAFGRNYGAPGELVFDFVNATASLRRVVGCTGQVIDGFLYPDLIYNVWCGAGTNGSATALYTTSDAGGTVRATTGLTVNGVTSGRYLVMPDLRGLSPIGLGTNVKTAIAYAGGSALGAYLADQFQGHVHLRNSGGTLESIIDAVGGLVTFTGGAQRVFTATNTGAATTDGTNGTPRTGLYTSTPGFACRIGMRY